MDVAGEQTAELLSIGDLVESIRPDLDRVEAVLQAELRSDYPFVDEMVRYGCLLGGKRLRPALLLLSGRASGELQSQHYMMAAVIEMIHTASLVHDDVLDEAATRRHLATVNSRWDSESSVLLGDFLFTHAFYLASTLGSTAACCRIGQATNQVCEGELRQKGTRGDLHVTEEDYLSIIEAKTAELCACSCGLGASFSGAEKSVIERFDTYGRCLGIAFQIEDDVLDIVGDESVTGKSLGTDLSGRKPTLPLIRLMEMATATERTEIVELLDGETESLREALWPYFDRHGTIQYARSVARRYVDRAFQVLDGLPANPALEILGQLAQSVVYRAT